MEVRIRKDMSTSSLTVREGTEKDLNAINDIYNHYVLHTCTTFDYETWDHRKRFDWYQKILGCPDYSLLVAESEGHVVGFAYNGAFRERKAYDISSELSIYTSNRHSVKGTGSALMEALLKKSPRVRNPSTLFSRDTSQPPFRRYS
ncbi:GNAT family N-acetyltransferase [Veronia nyctiphanis]|uniref:GNAT family N-acetyltransferase n=1 Tax=Veronia nyctiphanis TaxID=1278244 RepID=UPI001F35AE39|nr:GNAT family N-acetyltransferase [Veronia nyctiphanis]